MRSVGGKCCHFSRRYRKSKKAKIWIFGKDRPQSPKSLGALYFVRKMQGVGGKCCYSLTRYGKQKQSSNNKQKHTFTFVTSTIDKSCFQVLDPGFKFQDLAVARTSLVHSTATYNQWKASVFTVFSASVWVALSLQDAPGELQELFRWILGGRHICIYVYCIHVGLFYWACQSATRFVRRLPGRPKTSRISTKRGKAGSGGFFL